MKTILGYIYLIICLLMPISTLQAQDISFFDKIWDFGSIKEDGGVVQHTFKFKNTEKKPIVIVAVRTTCGCTTSDYTRKPIAPGKESTLTINYDPMYRPGKFDKDIYVYTSSGKEPTTLTIKGDVEPRKMSVEESFPFDMGEGLRLKSNYYAMSYISHGEAKQSVVEYINNSDEELHIEIKTKDKSSSGFLTIKYPHVIAPREKGFIPIIYEVAKESGYYGSLHDDFNIYINGHKSVYPLMINGHAIEKFNEDRSNYSACANIDKRIINFAELKRSVKEAEAEFIVENTGVENLILRRIESEDAVNVHVITPKEVKPGESMVFKVSIDLKELDYGPFSQYITLTFNDQSRPMQRIRVAGKIIK